jgi:hypothetical protein
MDGGGEVTEETEEEECPPPMDEDWLLKASAPVPIDWPIVGLTIAIDPPPPPSDVLFAGELIS